MFHQACSPPVFHLISDLIFIKILMFGLLKIYGISNVVLIIIYGLYKLQILIDYY